MGTKSEPFSVQCTHCKSDDVRIKAYRENSVSYVCKSCDGHFSIRNDDRESLVEQLDPNHQKVSTNIRSVGNTPPTAKDIFDRFDFDESLWSTSKFRYKETQKHTSSDGFFTLYNVEAEISRLKAVPTEIPAIQPVRITLPEIPKSSRTPIKRTTKKAVLLPDGHIGYRRELDTGKLQPFHDREVWDIAFQVIREIEPDVIVVQGDMIDLPEMTEKFIRTPDMYFTTQPAIIECVWLLSRLRAEAPDARIAYLEGNHEQRMSNIVINNLSAAYCVSMESISRDYPALSIPALMGLDALDIEWLDGYPDNAIWLNENLRVIHGDKSKSKSGQTSDAYLDNARSSVIFGHTHRRERACKTLYHQSGAKIYESACPGMMGNPNRVPARGVEHDWQQGIAIVDYQEGDGGFDIQFANIHNNKETIFLGTEFVGEDYTEELKAFTKWESF